MKATCLLKAEHEGIQIMLRVLEKVFSRIKTGEGFELQQFESILEFLKVFVDRCHHGKEEDLLFPALEAAGIANKGGPIGQMLAEHEQGRRYIAAMEAAFKAFQEGKFGAEAHVSEQAALYAQLLNQHIYEENNVLFPMADSLLSAERQDSLYEEFEKLEEEKIGKGVHEQFHKLLNDLARTHLDVQ